METKRQAQPGLDWGMGLKENKSEVRVTTNMQVSATPKADFEKYRHPKLGREQSDTQR